VSIQVLALETSGNPGSLAVLQSGQLVRQVVLPSEIPLARTLAPGIRDLLRAVGWRPADLSLIAVTSGPGSFTGLRLGLATAKTLAQVLDTPVFGVNTLRACAELAPAAAARIWSVLDAQRRELFAAQFERASAPLADVSQSEVSVRIWKELSATKIVPRTEWLAALAPGDWVTGPGLGPLRDLLPSVVNVLPESSWLPLAEDVGRLAWQAHQRGERISAWELLPLYLRRSAAEEKWDARHGNAGPQPGPDSESVS